MVVTSHYFAGDAQRAGFVATERLYLDENGRVVKANDSSRRTLLCSPGTTIPHDRAVHLGLIKEDKPDAPKNKATTPARTQATNPRSGRPDPSE